MKRTLRILSSFVCLLSLVALVLTGCNFGTKPQSTTPSDGTTAGNPPAVTTPSETTTPGNDSPINPLGKQIPVYQGMSISTAAGVTMPSFAKEGNNGNDNTDNNGNHYGWYKGDSADDKGDVDQETPFPDANENIEQEIKDSLEVIGSKQEIYYTAQNQDVYIHIYISNPDQFEILSFTLNGQKYSSYMFESGSTQELLILKYNVGAAHGIVEYTIDQIKYIDGTEIKDVKIGGDRTVKAGIRTEDQVTATVTNLQIGTNSVSFNATIADEDNLIAYNNGVIKAVLFDGDTLVAEKELIVGSNAVAFENLKNGTVYQYAIVACYDNLTGDAIGFHVLAKKAFQTNNIVLFDNIVVGQDNINFTFKWDESVANKVLTSLKLYKDGELVTALETNATTASGLLSANEYVLIAEYQDLGQPATISLTFATLQKGVPDISIINPTQTQTSVGFEIVETDTDNVGAITKIELVHANGTVVAENVDVRSFANLLSNNAYTVKVTYTYDLNDGKGEQMIVKEKEVVTLAKAVPEISIINPTKTQTSVGFEIVETDTDNVGAVTKIELVHTNGTIVAENVDVRSFANLLSNNAYTVKVTYTYDLNDGKGEQTLTVETKITTDAKAAPQVAINNEKATAGNITAEYAITDIDSTLASYKVELYKGETLIAQNAENVINFTGLDYLVDYTITITYTYDLNDGKGVQTATATKTVKMASTGFAYTVNADGTTCTIAGIGTCTDTEVYIPEKINGYTVTAIGEQAFAENSTITFIRIPNTVTTIGKRAFYKCTALEEIFIPESVNDIGTQIFYGCDKLTTAYYNGTYGSSENPFLNVKNLETVVFGGSYVPYYVAYNAANIKTITILDGVTSIEYSAFEGCSSLTSITIPDSVTSIGDYAFSSCRDLTSITIPNSVTSIGSYAFMNCSSLTSITIPDSINGIFWGEFSGCSSLTSIVIPDSVTTIGYCAFNNCSSLTTIVIPDSVTSIGQYAFGSCSDLKSVVMGNGVTIIDRQAFYQCGSLTSIIIPHNVIDIRDNTFFNCANLASITIPDSVTYIDEDAFSYCSSLISITFEGTIAQWDAIKKGTNWDYRADNYAVYCTDGILCKNHNYESVVITDPTATENGLVKYTCSVCGDSYTEELVPTDFTITADNRTWIGYTGEEGENLVIPAVFEHDGAWYRVTSIGDSAFQNCSRLANVTIPNSVTNIGAYAFQYCYILNHITIPNSVTSIGGYAFELCSIQMSITFGETIEQWNTLSSGEFIRTVFPWEAYETDHITFNVFCSDGVLCLEEHTVVVEKGISPTCTTTGLTEGKHCSVCGVTLVAQEIIPETGIHNYERTVVTEPTLTENGYATYSCSMCGETYGEAIVLTDLTITADNRTWVGYTGAEGENLVIPSIFEHDGTWYHVTSIGDSAFDECRNLASVTIPEGVTSIGGEAFYYCESLTTVVIPEGVTSIGSLAFCFCGQLTNVTIPSTVTNLDLGTFKGAQMTSVVIPDGITSIPDHLFEWNESLQSITIPNSVTSIGTWAFYNNTALTTITFKGTIEQWNALAKADGWNELAGDYTIYCTDGVICKTHTEVIDEAVAPTCTETGLTEGSHCSVCNETLVAQEIVDALGHTEVIDESVAPTCTETGLTEGKHCSVCSEVLVAQTVVNALGHTEVIIKGQEPNCVEFGMTDGKYCSVCNEVLVAQEVIMVVGPHIGEAIIVPAVAPTCSATGLTEGTNCTVCGGSIISQEIIPTLDHTVIIDKAVAPTCAATGRTEGKHCSVCSEILVAQTIINALPHTEVIDAAIAPSFGEVGRTEGKHCSVCGTVLVAQELTLSGSRYGYHDFANQVNGDAMQKLYYDLYCICEEFLNSTHDIEAADGLYILSTIDVSGYSLTIDEAIAVWKVFYMENPKYYWLSNTITVVGASLTLCIDEAYANADYRALCDASIEEMVDECYEIITVDLSALEKALAIHDFILEYMEYAYESDGVTPESDIWAHNMIGCAKYNLGVCESYAKTYLYLCLLNDVECIIVDGDAGEDHAWNMICLDDIWYAVDCTWDDTNESGLTYDYFGMSKAYLESTHTANTTDGVGIEYLFALPELSERSLELVYLYEGDTLLGTFGNIDMAFEAMANTAGDYTIKLYEYTYSNLGLVGFFAIDHHIYSAETPTVLSLTMVGYKLDLSNGFFAVPNIIPMNNLTLNSNIGIDNICLTQKTDDIRINIQHFSLITQGYYCNISVSIVGDDSSKIINETSYSTEICSSINVYMLTGTMGEFLLRNNSNVVVIETPTLRVEGLYFPEIEINVDHLYDCDSLFIVYSAQVYIGKLSKTNNGTINISLQFGKVEECGKITLGEIDCPVYFILHGSITYLSGETESVHPIYVTESFAVLERVSDFEKMQFDVSDETGVLVAGTATHLYRISETGEVKIKDYTIQNDCVIIDNVVVEYVGESTEIVVPNGVIGIADYAFFNCTNITSVAIPDSVISIGREAFAYCNSLTSITIGNGVASIGYQAFFCCSSLLSITIPQNVTSIGDYLFYYCTALTSITIPNSITSIGHNAFAYSNLINITFNGTVEQWNTIELKTFWSNDIPATEVTCSDGTVTLS